MFIWIFKDVEINLKELRNITIRKLIWFVIDNLSTSLFYFLCNYGCVFKKDFMFLPMLSANIMLLFILQIDPGLLCYNSTTWWPTPSHEQPQALQPLEYEPNSRSMISCCFILILLVWFHFWLGKCHSKQQQSPCLEDLTQMNLVVCVFLKE